ncbi:MAG: hypothetical protein ACE5KT_10910 [Methanosarcinales archaeon]
MALEDLFINNSIAKILDHFIVHEGYEYTKNDVIKHTNISRLTVDAEVIKLTRKKWHLTSYK